MEPTIPQNSRLGLSAATALVRGDIVVIRPDSRWHAVVVDEPGPLTRALRWLRVARPPRDSRMLVRIVGVPGDEVRCCGSDGKALVNGHSVPMMVPDSQFRVVVPEGRYFVAGDAPSTAHSACYLSALGVEALVPTSRIEAQVARVGWPWSSIDISASAAPYVGIPGRPASPQPIIEAGKDPSC